MKKIIGSTLLLVASIASASTIEVIGTTVPEVAVVLKEAAKKCDIKESEIDNSFVSSIIAYPTNKDIWNKALAYYLNGNMGDMKATVSELSCPGSKG